MRKCKVVFLLVIVAAIQSRSLSAAVVTIPAGLQPGAEYRLVFVTDPLSEPNATSSNIANYNALVTSTANKSSSLVALATTWSAIASTATIDARDNTATNPLISTGLPIFALNGSEVAANNSDLWDGNLINPIETSELGLTTVSFIWSGTSATGTASSPLGSLNPTFGTDNMTSSNWVAISPADLPNSDRLSLYAISGILTVPVPEPNSIVLACFAVVGYGMGAIRRRQSLNRLSRAR